MTLRLPNILWLMTDEQRTDSLGCYGAPWAHTPYMDRLASQGVLFQNALTPSPVCVPARTAVLAAKYPAQIDVWHNKLDLGQPLTNLMGRFHEAGYQSASFGKQHYVGRGSAFEVEAGKSCSAEVHYFSYHGDYDEDEYDVVKYPGEYYNWIFGGRFPEDASRKTEAQAVALAMEWLEGLQPERPFFLRVSFNGPHTPVVPPEPFDRIIDPPSIRFDPECEGVPGDQPRWLAEELSKTSRASRLTGEQIAKMRAYYYGEVAFLDSQFGRLVAWMDERAMLRNTIVVYSSDHGTHLGDYGLVQKQTFYDPVVKVPYFFWYPVQIAEGVQVETPVTTQTMMPTLLELAGLSLPGDGHSESLAQVLVSCAEPEVAPVFSELTLESFQPHIDHDGRLVMVRMGDWKLSVCLDPDVHDHALYDLARDPYERHNLAGDPACRDRVATMLDLIHEHVAL